MTNQRYCGCVQDTQTSIGTVIAHHRQQRGWTQRQLGEQMGIGTSLVAKWEQGIRTPPHEWLVELDRVLGTTLGVDNEPTRRRRGPRPAAARSANVTREIPLGSAPVLVELTAEGVRVFHNDCELETVVVDVRAMDTAQASERVKQISELLLRSLDLPRPLADRVVRRLAEFG